MTHDNAALVRRWFEEVWNKGRLEAMDEMLAPGAVFHGHAPFDIGAEQFKDFYRTIRSAFPDIKIAIDFTLADNDRVAVRWIATATHSGVFLGYAATGRPVKITGVSIARVIDGKFVEAWDTWDQLGLMVQIGAALGHQFFAPPKSTRKAK